MTSTKKLRRLNVGTHEIYDGSMAADTWPVGIRASYPPILLKNILAATIACYMGGQSVDYVRKRYLKDWTPESVGIDATAFDLMTLHALSKCIDSISEIVIGNSHRLTYTSIQAIADFTFLKALRTLRVALDLSSKGLLHEALCVGRNALEMMCWAHRIFFLPEEDNPFKYYPEKTISSFKPVYAGIGKYYGYLSEYSHWRPHTHIPASNMRRKADPDEPFEVIYASGRNKWEAIANILFLLLFYTKAYCFNYTKLNCRSKKPNLVPEMISLHQALNSMWEDWRKFLKEIEDPYISDLFADIVLSHEMTTFLKPENK